jgi:hypothetical protein
MLTKSHANIIAQKLEAVIQEGRAHSLAVIYVNGVRVAQFGIRHGSRKDQSHDHIPKSIYYPSNKCLRLAQCTLNRPDWIKAMKEKGHIKRA